MSHEKVTHAFKKFNIQRYFYKVTCPRNVSTLRKLMKFLMIQRETYTKKSNY